MNTVARDPAELIAECQGLVRSLAVKIHKKLPPQVDLDDLIADGQMGLAQAARDYDPEVGTRFSTYAYYRIRGAIYDGISQLTWAPSARQRVRYEQLANDAMHQSLPCGGDAADASERTAPPQQELHRLGHTTARLAIVYLGTLVGEDTAGFEAVDEKSLSPEADFAQKEVAMKLRELIDELEEPLRNLINAVYFEGLTIQDAGKQLGMSKSWASRLHSKALDQMARSLRRLGV